MAVKGAHRVSGCSSNYKGSENIISNGSVVAVADGQCMIIVDQGKVTDQIMAGDGGSGTLQIELELPDGTEETVALQK